MADPLRIAASVAGLLATAGRIRSVLSGYVSTVVDAPQSAQDALEAVSGIHLVLEMVKRLLDVMSSLPSQRKMLLRLGHIAITFSNCVLTVSELESLVWVKSENDILQRLKWARTEKNVLRLLPRLESQKMSLSCMISVLTWDGHYYPLFALVCGLPTAVWQPVGGGGFEKPRQAERGR